MPGHEPDFTLEEVPIFIGPVTLGKMLDVPPIIANLMIETGAIKTFDVGPPGATLKRTTLKEVIDYYNHVT